MDTITQALVIADAKGTILSVNKTAIDWFGYSESEMLGSNVRMLMPSPDRERHDSYIRRHLKTGESRMIGIGRYVTALDKGGRHFPIDLVVGEAVLEGSHFFLAVMRDASGEESRRRALDELREEVAQSFRINAMGLLASAIAHEVNQPLAAIRNYVETVAELSQRDTPIEPAQLHEAMEACSQETERAGQIIHRLRQFMSRGEAELDRHSLKDLVNDGLALALPDGQHEGVEVKVELDPAVDSVLADGVQVEQVLFNLVRNAVQAMSSTPAALIKITSRALETMAEIIVEDSGPGVDAKFEEQLFLPFNSTKDDGLGVGLSISRAIIEAHGGQIWLARSDLGGAAFHFTVPRILEDSGEVQ
jgi:two-component system sensor kinase FixL